MAPRLQKGRFWEYRVHRATNANPSARQRSQPSFLVSQAMSGPLRDGRPLQSAEFAREQRAHAHAGRAAEREDRQW